MQWLPCTPMSVARSDFAAVVALDGLIVTIGGRNHFEYLSTVEIYNTTSGVWGDIVLPDLPTPRYAHAAVLTQGKVLVLGGKTYGSQSLDSVLALDLHAVGAAWQLMEPLGVGRTGLSAAVLYGGQVLAVGGRQNTSSWLPTAEVFDWECECWQTLEARLQKEGREGAVAVAL